MQTVCSQDLTALVEEMSKTFQQKTIKTNNTLILVLKRKLFSSKCLLGEGKDEKGKKKKNV